MCEHIAPKYTVYHLLSPLLIEQFNAAGQGLDGLLEAAGANNVLHVLQHALIMLCLTFRFHHGNLLHLTLGTGQNNTDMHAIIHRTQS